MDTNDAINRAYNAFKGSAKNSNIPQAKEVLRNVSTARTQKWDGVRVLAVHLKKDGEWTSACQEIIEKNNLEKIDEEKTSHHHTLYYTRKEDVNRLS